MTFSIMCVDPNHSTGTRFEHQSDFNFSLFVYIVEAKWMVDVDECQVVLTSDITLPVTRPRPCMPRCRHRRILAGVGSQQIDERTWKRTPLLGKKCAALITKELEVLYRFRERWMFLWGVVFLHCRVAAQYSSLTKIEITHSFYPS